jgi:uncharacterized protein
MASVASGAGESVGPEADGRASLEPVARAARIAELDYVRGLAVLGILLVNMPLYNAPFDVFFSHDRVRRFTSAVDVAALWFVRIFAEAKFYTLFSFLFGVGFGVQLSRALARGVPRFEALYRRRLGVLFFLGLVHQYLFWVGDVLHVYAAYGFVLLLFRHRTQKTVLAWALAIMFLPAVGGTAFMTVQAVRGKPTAEERAQREVNRRIREPVRLARIEDDVRTYTTGSWSDVHVARARHSVERLPAEMLGWGFFEVLPMFLLGFWVARSGLVEDIPGHLPLVRRLFLLGCVGFLLTALTAAWRLRLGPYPTEAQGFFDFAFSHAVVRPLHALGYATGLVLLVQRESWRRALAALAAAGRMAASNYVGQSLVCVVLFYGVGLGFGGLGGYGRTGFAEGVMLTVAIWAFQLAFSAFWLARFRFGPLEWLWRSLTYGRLQPLRLPA